jgi:hypothetical protein
MRYDRSLPDQCRYLNASVHCPLPANRASHHATASYTPDFQRDRCSLKFNQKPKTYQVYRNLGQNRGDALNISWAQFFEGENANNPTDQGLRRACGRCRLARPSLFEIQLKTKTSQGLEP